MKPISRHTPLSQRSTDRLLRTPTPWSRRVLAAGLLATTIASEALSATLQVPADQPTVRAAVAAAATGDTILVAPGIHTGGVWINGKSLTIASHYVITGDTAMVAQTVLDGVGAGACGGVVGCTGSAVLEFGDNAHGSAVVGLTLRNGENGIASGSIVDITRCRVIANGDGVDYVTGSGGTIRNSLFANNSDDGIDLNGRMDMTIQDNEIRDNQDDGIEFRLYAFTGAPRTVVIIGNRITGNGEDGVQIIDYPGVGSYVLRIERNLFQANFNATGLSAAIACMPNAETIETLVGTPMTKRMYVINNTFIGEKNGLVGGANAIVLNNIFTGTEGTALRRVGGASIASYNLFWNNGTDHLDSVVDAAHQIQASPLLDATGIPSSASPAINAGTAVFQWQGETVLSLAAGAYAGSAPDLGAFETATTNLAPQVSAGPDQVVFLSSDILEIAQSDVLPHPTRQILMGTVNIAAWVTDDGFPQPPSLSLLWSTVSAPGPVIFSDTRSVKPQVTFWVPGTYYLRLTADDGELTSWDLVKVTVRSPINQFPTVYAGQPLTIHLPEVASLEATVVDDGLPDPPRALTMSWSKGSGPGPVTFDTPTLRSTRAAFTTIGGYVLRLSVSDGELQVTDSVVVTVLPTRNRVPAVGAGADQTIMIPSDAILDGTVTDDGLPNPPAAVATTWSAVSGPGPVTFADASLADTRASFTAAGTYLLRLTAHDGAAAAADTVMITVQPPPPAVERRLSAAMDDAEERNDGHIVRKTAGLDLVDDSGNQTVGLRFTSVAIPNGATIIAAYIQFKADGTGSEATALVIQGQATDDPTTFTYGDFDISSRPRTAYSAGWSPPPWTVVGEAGMAQRTSDLSAVVQELVDRPGWASGNAMAFIITGTGRRTARTQEADAAGAALLHIEYGGLQAVMNAGPSAATEPGQGAALPSAAEAEAPVAPDASIWREGAAITPSGLEFAIVGLSPQPSRGGLRVEFTLADDGPVVLDLMDIAGRRVASQTLATFGAGGYAVDVRERLPAGVYLVRLRQGPRTAMKKAVVLD